jgi:PPOX class probable F420-dependent enzyme
MKTTNLAMLYGADPMDWAPVVERLERGVPQSPGSGGPDRHTCWLTTINPDGSPHVTGVGGLWVDGSFWFSTGPGTRKGRNIARDPRCALSVATTEFDLVVEGDAVRVDDPALVAEMARRWGEGGWPARVDETGLALTAEYSAQSAGPPPWHVYRLTPRRATAVETVAPGRATSWSF